MAVSFAHVSDLHFRCDYKRSNMTDNFEGSGNPTEKLLRAFAAIKERQKPDFILLTGDLVHEGEKEDYIALKALFLEHFPHTPIVAVPGNHDRRQAFCEGFLDAAYDGEPVDFCREYGGLKIIGLDGGTAKAAGQISDAQLGWLRNSLGEKGPEGTVLAIHQPFITGFDFLDTKAPKGFSEALIGKIDAIFCGHTHVPNLTHYHSIPQLTAGGIGFGMELENHVALMSSQASINLCRMDKGRLDISWQLVYPVPTIAEVLQLGGMDTSPA